MNFTGAKNGFRVLVAGAGPAGSSLAIRLARSGHDVTLLERERFPRHKLCGEFISPECLSHFSELGVLDEMLSAGGERVRETRFFEKNGRSFSVPGSLLDERGYGLSLSRARMDHILCTKARSAGAEVIDGVRITDVLFENGRPAGVEMKNLDGLKNTIAADVFVDATGRAMALSRLSERAIGPAPASRPSRSLAVGFKAHFTNADIPAGVCEIYFFPGGYGGLTSIEDGQVNLCFLTRPEAAKRAAGDADRIMRELVIENRRASHTLRAAKRAGDWLAVSISSFGKRSPVTGGGILAVGDSASFIDPFTGSGMLMAFESSSILAGVLDSECAFEGIGPNYSAEYARAFDRRLRVSACLRWASFLPVLPSLAISLLSLSRHARMHLAAATRRSRPSRTKSA